MAEYNPLKPQMPALAPIGKENDLPAPDIAVPILPSPPRGNAARWLHLGARLAAIAHRRGVTTEGGGTDPHGTCEASKRAQ